MVTHRLRLLEAAASDGRLREEVGPISADTCAASADTRGPENRAAISDNGTTRCHHDAKRRFHEKSGTVKRCNGSSPLPLHDPGEARTGRRGYTTCVDG